VPALLRTTSAESIMTQQVACAKLVSSFLAVAVFEKLSWQLRDAGVFNCDKRKSSFQCR
jgi:hypothetical protein